MRHFLPSEWHYRVENRHDNAPVDARRSSIWLLHSALARTIEAAMSSAASGVAPAIVSARNTMSCNTIRSIRTVAQQQERT
jgi:hypothetical protein